ncbi:hypothetical protein [Paenibacillus radicis (ex Gao et al. 2016)]|uniref:Uncharacterized protein n=1 Tax=Paenibacillus radicis (ex Gao et al. 2016) TaxID=1737354 RepID=A0A917HR11_9BACL|nr:hypothetical protein [Paenibacillus radicis (ex Gao et al. 2016)]GGG86333.1 hypothetical protein GCM10010918_50650 [Paenibacillus radicis (ex Gao et al. 2016)]
MGVKFTAIFNNNNSTFEKIENLKRKLKLEWSKKRSEDNSLDWSTIYCDDPKEHFERYGHVGLMGSNGDLLNISSNLIELQSEVDWFAFLKFPETREEVRADCLLIAGMVGNPIYLPDSYSYSSFVFEGNTFDDVLSSLQKKYGEPMKDIACMLIQNEFYWETTGYYIDSLI